MPTSVRIKFPGHDGHLLDARLEMPDNEPRCFTTFSHCFTCTKDTLAAFRISKALAAMGIATLRFDFAGLGGSEGDFSDTSFSTTKLDLLAAANYLAEHYAAPTLLIGHSLGGTTALACAADIESVQGVVTIASPSRPAHVLHHFGDTLALLEQGNSGDIEVSGQHYTIKPQFLDDIHKHDMQTTLAALAKPILIFTIKHDALVDTQNALDIEAWAAGDTTLITLDDADHILSDRQDTDYVAQTISAWQQLISTT